MLIIIIKRKGFQSIASMQYVNIKDHTSDITECFIQTIVTLRLLSGIARPVVFHLYWVGNLFPTQYKRKNSSLAKLDNGIGQMKICTYRSS